MTVWTGRRPPWAPSMNLRTTVTALQDADRLPDTATISHRIDGTLNRADDTDSGMNDTQNTLTFTTTNWATGQTAPATATGAGLAVDTSPAFGKPESASRLRFSDTTRPQHSVKYANGTA